MVIFFGVRASYVLCYPHGITLGARRSDRAAGVQHENWLQGRAQENLSDSGRRAAGDRGDSRAEPPVHPTCAQPGTGVDSQPC